jgi:hypothetical protein
MEAISEEAVSESAVGYQQSAVSYQQLAAGKHLSAPSYRPHRGRFQLRGRKSQVWRLQPAT